MTTHLNTRLFFKDRQVSLLGWFPSWEEPPRGGGGHRFGDERPPTSLSSSVDAARVPPWAIAPPGSPTTSTQTHTHAPHTAFPVGSNLGRARPPTQPVEAGRGAKQQQQLGWFVTSYFYKSNTRFRSADRLNRESWAFNTNYTIYIRYYHLPNLKSERVLINHMIAL